MILDIINSLVLEGWDCLLCTKILLTKLFHISVCDVLPHLLASNNLKVDVTKQNGKDCDSQDDEVCLLSILCWFFQVILNKDFGSVLR